ncbi:hypothetical protein F5148DRAFT_1147409 [Russula earlei]|uniref:Uncharacterized protein n=1 Tax=Russula earlei TaxID=71964 RepID=A0ACC0UGG1_9AGAM|nr:hypothetical protein F5148DRAFT_1147409 [Russula earlei]
MSKFSASEFLDLEAILLLEDEEEEYESEGEVDDFGLQPNPVGCATLATTRSRERFQGRVQEERQLVLQAVRHSNFLIARPEYILCDDVGIVGIFKYVDGYGILKDKVHDLQNKLVELRLSLYLCGPSQMALIIMSAIPTRARLTNCMRAACSRRIPSQHAPDAGLVFDTLHKRETFVSHPARLFSMTFLFAALVIHKSVLCTSHADMNINETSSYVDLAPLYGNNKETLDNVGVAATARRQHQLGSPSSSLDSYRLRSSSPVSTCCLRIVHALQPQLYPKVYQGDEAYYPNERLMATTSQTYRTEDRQKSRTRDWNKGAGSPSKGGQESCPFGFLNEGEGYEKSESGDCKMAMVSRMMLWESDDLTQAQVDTVTMDEPVSDDNAPLPHLPSVEVQDLEDETRRITVPWEDDPHMWSVWVKIHPPAVTLAFTLSSMPGHVFIEAFNITDVCCVVNGLVTVHDKQLIFILPTECIKVLSSHPLSCSWIEKGQWYCDDIGYICESSIPMNQWYAVMAFVPQIPQPGGKWKRDGHPSPQAWTARELTQQYGENRVKVLGPGHFGFKGCLYQDGLAFELLPWSILCILEHCNFNITLFGKSDRIRGLPAFTANLRCFTQDSVQIGNYVKIHWLDCFGMVITMDHKEHKHGLYVGFPGAGGAMHRGLVTQISGGRAEIIDETNKQHMSLLRSILPANTDSLQVLIDEDNIAVLGIQNMALPKPKHNSIWEGQRVSIIRGPLKGYYGLVKADNRSSVDIELDAKLMSHGPLHQWVKLDDIQLEHMLIALLGCSNLTPPPEDLPRSITPEPVEHKESASSPWSLPQGPVWKHWLFVEEIQEWLCEECIPFHVWGVPISSLHAKIEGLGAKTVPAARQKIEAQSNEVVVSVIQSGRPTQISINPTYLIPWPPSEGNKVLIIGHRWTGQVGKVIESKHRCCTVELEASGAVSYFYEQDVVNLLMK